MRVFVLIFFLFSLTLTSCRNEVESIQTLIDSAEVTNSVKPTKNFDWNLLDRYRFDNKIRPYGISNFNQYLAISDYTNDRVVFFDTLDKSVLVDLAFDKPGFIKVRKSTLVVPSESHDSMYYFKGKNIKQMQNFKPMDSPSGVDVNRVDHWVLVDRGNKRVLFKNEPKGIQTTFGETGDSDFRFEDPTNVLLIDTLICVLDTGKKRVQVFTETGTLYSSISYNDNWIFPTGISNEEDTLYISDPVANRIDLFTVNGDYLETIYEHLKGPTDINYYDNKLFIANNLDSTITILKEVN